jgi:hypothetical protein
MCRIASLFLLQRLKGSMSGDARDFNNIETRAVIKFFSPARQGAFHHQLPFMVRMGRTDRRAEFGKEGRYMETRSVCISNYIVFKAINDVIFVL